MSMVIHSPVVDGFYLLIQICFAVAILLVLC